MHKISDFKMPEQLSLDAGWSIGETAFERITTSLLQMSPVERILEFGVVRVLSVWLWRFRKPRFCLWKATGEILQKPRI